MPPTPHIFWPLTVLVPYLALIGVWSLTTAREDLDWFDKAVDLAIDSAILGIGIWGALIGSAEVQTVLGPNALNIGLPTLLGGFVLIGIAVNVKTSKKMFPARKTTYSVLIATLIFGINLALVVYVNEHKALQPTILWGLAGWLVPFIACAVWVGIRSRQR